MNLEVYADADWCGGWNWEESTDDEATAKSRSGYVAYFAGCIVLFQSKLKTLITLSTTEAEYVPLSHALRETIPIMNIINGMSQHQLGTFKKRIQDLTKSSRKMLLHASSQCPSGLTPHCGHTRSAKFKKCSTPYLITRKANPQAKFSLTVKLPQDCTTFIRLVALYLLSTASCRTETRSHNGAAVRGSASTSGNHRRTQEMFHWGLAPPQGAFLRNSTSYMTTSSKLCAATC